MELTPAVFALLLALSEGEQHGYALMAEVSSLTDGTITLGPGTLYRSLQRMRVDGLVEEVEVPEDVRRADRRAERRRSYRITQAGRAVAAGEVRRLASLLAKAPAQKLLSIEPPGVP